MKGGRARRSEPQRQPRDRPLDCGSRRARAPRIDRQAQGPALDERARREALLQPDGIERPQPLLAVRRAHVESQVLGPFLDAVLVTADGEVKRVATVSEEVTR